MGGVMKTDIFMSMIKGHEVTEPDINLALDMQQQMKEEGKETGINKILVDMGVVTADHLNRNLDLREGLNRIDFINFLMHEEEKKKYQHQEVV